MTFPGFGEPTFRLLRALARENSRAEFEARRADYVAHYVGAAREFVEAIAPRVQRFAPELVADARIDGSIVRLHRDARFVADGPPYKEQLEVWLWEGERRSSITLLSLVVAPRGTHVGVGARRLRGPTLAAYRAAIEDPGARGALERIARGLQRSGFELSTSGASARARAGGTSGEPARSLGERISTARMLCATLALPPEVVRSPALVPQCAAAWKRLLPLHRWLREHVQAPAAKA